MALSRTVEVEDIGSWDRIPSGCRMFFKEKNDGVLNSESATSSQKSRPDIFSCKMQLNFFSANKRAKYHLDRTKNLPAVVMVDFKFADRCQQEVRFFKLGTKGEVCP
jgi:hypothetical protein